jgi:hypothetical protein
VRTNPGCGAVRCAARLVLAGEKEKAVVCARGGGGDDAANGDVAGGLAEAVGERERGDDAII